ncbi:helix-turn-helix domain-containing protein [Mesorhizobium sp. CAU 1741]|uniref:TetR/AcrR family transcriptional regulator n=1 Tax=Mesorhizobium sp. CAU 1741 TaxID=3140366 RepID=UPI00325B907D
MNEEVRAETADTRRTAKILDAATRLYLAYGARRTSMDDIAIEAGMAKGSLYLSFKSKEELFHALIEHLLRQWLASARSHMAKATSTTETLVAYLDVAVGEPARLLGSTPHAVDLLEAKGRLAGELLSNYRRDVAHDLSLLLAGQPSMQPLVLEAAYGCRETGDMASDAYRQRLSRHIAVLLEPR